MFLFWGIDFLDTTDKTARTMTPHRVGRSALSFWVILVNFCIPWWSITFWIATRGYPPMISEGQSAPDFTLLNQEGNQVSLSGLKGQPLILYFYPRDATPGCTTEACDFRDAHPKFEAAGAKVIANSPDTPGSHRKFADKYELPFTLLADPEHKVCELFGVWKEKSMYGKKSMGVERTTVLIDANGVVRRIFPKVKVAGHVTKVMEALGSL
jgi:peroxiredoxin Q/BCP